MTTPSSGVDERFTATLELAERIRDILRAHHVDAVVIGAMALAVHNYPRETEDVDLAIAVPPTELSTLADAFRDEGWQVELRTPDASDPLGGVIDVQAPGADLVQLVNFDNSPAGGFPRLVREAVATSLPLSTTDLRVVDLANLIAFKLYAGGAKSKLDVLELLERNQPLDMRSLRERCRALGLGKELERVLALAQEP